MLYIFDDKFWSTQANEIKKCQDVPSDVGRTSGDIKNLSIIVKIAESKKSKLAEYKSPDLNFVRTNSSKTDFLTSKAKKTLITQKKPLPRYQSPVTPTRNTISVLKPTLRDTPSAESPVR